MLREIYGWSKGSDMPSTYIHLSGEAVKKALLAKHGLDQAVTDPKIVPCPRCKAPNEPNASMCVKCASAMNLEDAISISDIKDEMHEQSELVQKLQAKIDLMQQGIIERDRQYFQLRRPDAYKKIVKNNRSQKFNAKSNDN